MLSCKISGYRYEMNQRLVQVTANFLLMQVTANARPHLQIHNNTCIYAEPTEYLVLSMLHVMPHVL